MNVWREENVLTVSKSSKNFEIKNNQHTRIICRSEKKKRNLSPEVKGGICCLFLFIF